MLGEPHHEALAFGNLRKLDELVRLVSLRNVAGAADKGWHIRHLEEARLGRIGNGFRLVALRELQDQRFGRRRSRESRRRPKFLFKLWIFSKPRTRHAVTPSGW